MQTFDLTQKLLSFGPSYEVRPPGDTPDGDPLVTIRGKLLSATPRLDMVQGESGAPVGTLKGNFTRTKFDCVADEGELLGSVIFPMIALKKSFTLRSGDAEYQADGGYLAGEFVCKDSAGNVVMRITKQLSLRDKFRIEADDVIPTPLALLAAVAVDQRFFQE